MRPFAARVAVALALFLVSQPAANAGSAVVQISGNLGDYSWDSGTPVSDGSFSGTVTFSALPDANSTVHSGTADINFYNSSDSLVFTVQYGVYATMTANSTDYTVLDVSGYGGSGNTGYHIDGLDLVFSSWPIGSSTETVDATSSGLEFQDPSGKTWFNPLLSGNASVPEPSSILLGLIGMAGAGGYVRQARRKATA